MSTTSARAVRTGPPEGAGRDGRANLDVLHTAEATGLERDGRGRVAANGGPGLVPSGVRGQGGARVGPCRFHRAISPRCSSTADSWSDMSSRRRVMSPVSPLTQEWPGGVEPTRRVCNHEEETVLRHLHGGGRSAAGLTGAFHERLIARRVNAGARSDSAAGWGGVRALGCGEPARVRCAAAYGSSGGWKDSVPVG